MNPPAEAEAEAALAAAVIVGEDPSVPQSELRVALEEHAEALAALGRTAEAAAARERAAALTD